MRPISKLSDRVEASNVPWFVIGVLFVLFLGILGWSGGMFQ